MIMGLTAVKNINCKQTKFIPHRRGRWRLLPWTQVEHKRQGGCVQKYLQKHSNLFLGSVSGCEKSGAGGKHRDGGSRRTSEAEGRGCGQKSVQLEAGWLRTLVSPRCPAAGGMGSHSSMLSSNSF